MFKSTIALLLVMGAVAACEGGASLDALRNVEASGDAYQQALINAYRDEAEHAAERYDWAQAEYFATQGLRAADGEEVIPPEPALSELPDAERLALSEARTKLVDAVAANRTTQPEMASAAMLAYDRWLAQAQGAGEEILVDTTDAASAINAARVIEQRTLFEAVLAKLDQAYAASGADLPTTTIAPESDARVLYFPFDSDRIGDSATAALNALVEVVAAKPEARISVNGHADRVGSVQYNLDLSERRSRFVVKALTHSGVDAARISYFAFGESDPAIPTADGVAEPRNRRVEIAVE